MAEYDYLIVGAGLYGSVMARQLADAGRRCLVIDKREHAGGNLYCENIEGINVHKYGAHIFHTSNREVWQFVNRYTELRVRFIKISGAGVADVPHIWSCRRRNIAGYVTEPKGRR